MISSNNFLHQQDIINNRSALNKGRLVLVNETGEHPLKSISQNFSYSFIANIAAGDGPKFLNVHWHIHLRNQRNTCSIPRLLRKTF